MEVHDDKIDGSMQKSVLAKELHIFYLSYQNVVSLNAIYLPKIKKTPNIMPMRVRYGVSFVSSVFAQFPSFVITMHQVILY